jgi:hypothetical protein
MALRLLAGPFPVRDIEGNYARFTQPPMWSDAHMALLATGFVNKPTGDTSAYGALVQIDGTLCVRNPARTAYDRHDPDLAGTGLAINSNVTGGIQRGVNPVTLVPEGEFITDTMHLGGGGFMLLQDRILTGTGGISSRVYGATGSATLEQTISPGLDTGGLGVKFSLGPAPGQVFVAGRDSAVLYDYVNRALVGWRRWFPTLSQFPPTYSAALGVWVVINTVHTPQTHDTLTVYADEAVPATLSAPVALTPASAGSASEYRVRVLGSSGEPCVDVLVDWAVNSPGVLLAPQSTTDGNGYATTRVALPLDSVGVTVTVTAEVNE